LNGHPKIAIVSTGLGRIRRGFESFSESLFQSLRRSMPDLDVQLFQGGRRGGQRRHRVPNFHRAEIPARWLGEYRGNLLEKRSFAVALYPRLRAGRFDIVHYNELTMGSALFHLRRLLGGSFRLFYCNGAPSPPIHYHRRCDAAQSLSPGMHEEALAYGIAKERLFLVPYGIDTERFRPAAAEERREIRAELEIPADAFVVLSVGAIQREHKRMDYLIREVSGSRPDVWLLVAGQETADTAGLRELAQSLIPDRWRFVSWPHDRMARLYAAADVFVLASLREGFGMVILEAMASGLPTLLHDDALFRWMTGGSPDARFVDMRCEGLLRNELQGSRPLSPSAVQRNAVASRFSWEVLLPDYIATYECVLRLPILR